MQIRRCLGLTLLCLLGTSIVKAELAKFERPQAGLSLARPVRPGAFFDVIGRRAAIFGYEDRPLEAWIYPMKVLDDFTLSFALEGYPIDIEGRDVITSIEVRPEATTFTYSHAAFTVCETLFAPVDEPALVIVLDIKTTLPMRVTGAFRPRLRLMWPAGLQTANVGWDASIGRYALTEESGTFAAIVGSPGSRDLTLMPYQEEPKDVPLRFVRDVSLADSQHALVPIVIAGSVKGRREAEATYDRVLQSVPALYERNVRAYRSLAERTTDVDLPDDRLVSAFRWAKVGIEKGFAENPYLGTGLVAGFRTSGESERPGFAWFFGRDALWTTLAIDAYGDFGATRTALEFLQRHQRADGKIPHEVSQSATLVPWFDRYPYAWASADATPLFIVAHAEHWRATGDRTFLDRAWSAILKAYAFSNATDSDGDGLIENTNVGHGWVEGGALYPPHEEVYLQGVWVAALRGFEELARARGDRELAEQARARAEKALTATEARYWLADRGYYAFATAKEAGSAPDRLVEEDTVLPAVPMWWGLLQPDRADRQIDRLGSGELATDWGARILSSRSRLYDPLSYHYGSVWPLFTGWASMAAYRYGRPHVGYQALMANALLTGDGALGYVTELLSGAFNAAFGRSSHHQVWSEAMVITPLVRGLLGVAASDGGRTLHLRPQLPADWDQASVQRIAVGPVLVDATITRIAGRLVVDIRRTAGQQKAQSLRAVVAPGFPLDARVTGVRVNGNATRPRIEALGDMQFAEVVVADVAGGAHIEYALQDGSDVYVRQEPAAPGDESRQIRVLRSRAATDGLRLTLEGRGGRSYTLGLRTARRVDARNEAGVKIDARAGGDYEVTVKFEGNPAEYVRRDVFVPLGKH